MCKCGRICNFDPHLFMLQTFHDNYVVRKIILHTHVYTFEEFTIFKRIYTAVIFFFFFFYKMLIWASQSLVNLLMIDHCPQNAFEHFGMIFKYLDNLFAVNFWMFSHYILSYILIALHLQIFPLHSALPLLGAFTNSLTAPWMPVVSLCQDLLMSEDQTLASNGPSWEHGGESS